MNKLMIIAGGTVLVLVAALMFLAKTGPQTYQDMAGSEQKHCINNKGFGQWKASSGLSLEKFCQMYGDLKALEQAKKDHPEQF